MGVNCNRMFNWNIHKLYFQNNLMCILVIKTQKQPISNCTIYLTLWKYTTICTIFSSFSSHF